MTFYAVHFISIGSTFELAYSRIWAFSLVLICFMVFFRQKRSSKVSHLPSFSVQRTLLRAAVEVWEETSRSGHMEVCAQRISVMTNSRILVEF